MLPNASDLTFFVEIAASKNMSRAAERLGITQPALSQSMKRLEHNFGEQLLLRSKSGVTLTKAGEKLARKARSLLEEWNFLKEEAKKDQKELRGRYSLGVHTSVSLFTLQYFLPNLLKKYQELEIKLHHDLSRKVTEDV